MPLPLSKKLMKKVFLNIAELQDKFIDAIYYFDKDLVLYGGTAVWRCYSGNRFSYDIDALIRSEREAKLIRHELTWELSKRGAKLDKFTEIDHSIIIQVSDQNSSLKVEIRRSKNIKPIIKEYERADGTLLSVLTLSPESLILNKIETYERRRYIRDLYDIYYLLGYVKDKRKMEKKLSLFIRDIKPPLNEGDLKEIIYSGVAPSFKSMRDYIKSTV